jgi:hypothetical protein
MTARLIARQDFGVKVDIMNSIRARRVSVRGTVMTQQSQPHFRVAEYENSEPCIVLEPLDGDQEQTFRRAISFNLRPGASLREATAIVDYLRENLVGVSETY